VFTVILYILCAILLIISFFKDKAKTKQALMKSWKSFENILPQFITVLVLIGLMLAIISPETISKLIGKESGWLGMIIASIIGSITLIPGFVAFPLGSALLKSGAGFMQIAVFLSTLMMVGVVTMLVEEKYFGWKQQSQEIH